MTIWRNGAGATTKIATAPRRKSPTRCAGSSTRRPTGRSSQVTATLTINGQTATAVAGQTIFDLAGTLGVRVPTSCQANGKCKECVVEVVDGAEDLTPATPAEAHLRPPFRLACQTSLVDGGAVKCHTMRRGRMRIER